MGWVPVPLRILSVTRDRHSRETSPETRVHYFTIRQLMQLREGLPSETPDVTQSHCHGVPISTWHSTSAFPSRRAPLSSFAGSCITFSTTPSSAIWTTALTARRFLRQRLPMRRALCSLERNLFSDRELLHNAGAVVRGAALHLSGESS